MRISHGMRRRARNLNNDSSPKKRREFFTYTPPHLSANQMLALTRHKGPRQLPSNGFSRGCSGKKEISERLNFTASLWCQLKNLPDRLCRSTLLRHWPFSFAFKNSLKSGSASNNADLIHRESTRRFDMPRRRNEMVRAQCRWGCLEEIQKGLEKLLFLEWSA